jgi:hypothetical protein
MIQTLQVVGAILVLAGFAASQAGWLDGKSAGYLVLNVVGGAILAVVALADHDWGFLLLEGVWTLVSLASLTRLLAGARSA